MIFICQYLCPKRHCIIGMAYDSADYSEKEIETMLLEAGGVLNFEPRCGICGASDLHFEHEKSIFESIEQAKPVLEIWQTANLDSRAKIDAIKRQAKNN